MNSFSREDIDSLIARLSDNNIHAMFCSSSKEALDRLEELIPQGSTVGLGGSMTLEECGALNLLRKMDIQLFDRYKEGLSWEEVGKLRDLSLTADVFLSSTNALSMAGALINADGIGNRVSSQIYGPGKVIIVTGVNKLVKDVSEGLDRIHNLVAPKNARRLNISSPCKDTNVCVGEKCLSSQKRLCNKYTIIRGEWKPERLFVLIVDEELGY